MPEHKNFQVTTDRDVQAFQVRSEELLPVYDDDDMVSREFNEPERLKVKRMSFLL